MNPIVRQIKAWVARYRAPDTDENFDQLNKCFAVTYSTPQGKEVLDYLIGKYYKPIDFVGASDAGRLAERNGQQVMMVDILTRIDMGIHPAAHQESPSTEQPFDARV